MPHIECNLNSCDQTFCLNCWLNAATVNFSNAANGVFLYMSLRHVAERQSLCHFPVLSIWRNTICTCVLPILSPFIEKIEIRGELKLILEGKWLKLPLSFCQDKELNIIFARWEKKEAAGNRCWWVDSQRSAARLFQLRSLFCRRTVFVSVLVDKSLWQRNFRGALMSVAFAVL